MIQKRKPAAIAPPITGEIIQLAAIIPIWFQFAIPNPPAAIPAPRTPPTIAWVVETGAPKAVAMLSQRAPAKSAAIIKAIKIRAFGIREGSMIPFFTVLTTSPPAIKAPAASKIAAIKIAPNKVRALEPTAGPTLLATSLAPIFIAM